MWLRFLQAYKPSCSQASSGASGLLSGFTQSRVQGTQTIPARCTPTMWPWTGCYVLQHQLSSAIRSWANRASTCWALSTCWLVCHLTPITSDSREHLTIRPEDRWFVMLLGTSQIHSLPYDCKKMEGKQTPLKYLRKERQALDSWLMEILPSSSREEYGDVFRVFRVRWHLL